MTRANPASFREAASRFATGVAVLTALDEHGRVCGMTANSFVTVSLSPPTVLVSVMPGRMHRAISATGRYCVNVLPDRGRDLSQTASRTPAPVLTTTSSTACRACPAASPGSPARSHGTSMSATTR